jgi:hypothetical protein
MYKRLLLLFFAVPISMSVFSQYNFDAGYPVVYNILNTKCSNAGCHSATSTDALKFDGTPAAVYAAIVGQPPMNAAALARNEQLVWIDQPYQSYLLKKAGSWFDTDLSLPVGEPDSAAHVNAGLTNVEVEYIRQWIMDSAAQFMLNIDTSIINAYYNPADTGQIPFFPKLQQPAAGTGIQARFGPIFVRNTSGNNEVEYMLMRQIDLPGNMEVTGVQSSMSSMSHHFLLFQFPDSVSAVAQETGLRRVAISGSGVVSSFDGNKNLIAAWQTPSSISLPTGTAFFWPQTTYIDQDYHVKNYTPIVPGTSGIVPFDFYLNVTYKPRVIGDNTIQMQSQLVNNAGLILLPNQSTTLPYSDQSNGSGGMRYIWMMSSHTHKFGTGFNIYKYDNSMPGGIGDTLYQGTYDYANGIDLGVYDWEHPSVEYFSPQYPMNMGTNGVICQTTWDNTSSSLIHFGFTTNDEMQLFYYMYTTTLPEGANGVNTITKSAFDFRVYPNPMSDMGTISYTISGPSTVNASIVDITGKQIAMLKDENEQAGDYNVTIGKTLSSGMYFAKVNVNGTTYTKKFVVE